MPGSWIVVASADHVARGVAGGFVQACHGKRAPLARMRPGDQVFCYSPVVRFGGNERLRAFTAMGTVTDGAPCQMEMDSGFHPHRSRMTWTRTGCAPIRPLLDKLELTAGRQSWGMPFRAGLVAISTRDAALIGLALNLASATPRAARTAQRNAEMEPPPSLADAA